MFLKKIITNFDSHIQELLHGASVAFVLKIAAAGFAFGLNVVLARLLGPAGSGMFFLAFTIVVIVAAIGRIGMENALVRFIATNVTSGLPGKVLGVYKKAIFYSFIMATILSVLLYLVSPWLSHVIFSKPNLAEPLTIMSIAVVPLALLTLHAHALQGLKKIAASVSVQSIVVPVITCLIAILFVPKYGINAAVWGYIVATIMALLIGRRCWERASSNFNSHMVVFGNKELFNSSIPLFSGVILNMVITWSPMLFLGVWEHNENVGIFSAASRTSMLISFVLIAVNSIAAPKFAELYKQGNLKVLENVARTSAKMMMLFAFPLLFVFLMIPEFILSMFGEQFKQGAPILMVLAIGQFVNVSTGSVGYILMMTGNEILMRNNLLFIASLGVLLNVWLTSSYGVFGCAVAVALTLSIQNLIAMILVWKKLGIMTFPWINMMK